MTQNNKLQMARVKVPENLRAGFVSVGLPVYNGARYLRSALDSLVAQDYPHFEIIISDNGSDDETETICRDYAARNPKIRYYRVQRNMGAVWNALRVYELARGEYFMFAAHDDLRHPQYLSRSVAALNANPQALFCCTDVKVIDEAGRDISENFPFQSYPPIGPTPYDRVRALIRSTCWLHIYSLIRTPALAQTRFGSLMWGGDVVLVAEMCLRGEVAYLPEALFSYRYFVAKTTKAVADSFSTPDVPVPVSWSGMAADLLESVRLSPLSSLKKLRLRAMIAVEFCVRNPNVSWAIGEERFAGARKAFAGREYRRALMLAFIGLMKQTTNWGERMANSARYRGSKLKSALSTDERTTSGRKLDN